MLAPAEDQPHLIEALDAVVRRLGGLTHRWRFDRMATVCHPDSGWLTATFGPVAAHYAVGIAICPPRRGNRKGVVEKANLTAAQRWWRTLADELSRPARRPAWTVLRAGRGQPSAAPGGWGSRHGGRAGRRGGPAAGADRALPGRADRAGPGQPQALVAVPATATPWGPATPARR